MLITPRYLNARQAAVYLGLVDGADEESLQRGVNALYQQVHRREVPYIKQGGRLRFDRHDLDAMMAKLKRPTRDQHGRNNPTGN